MADVFEITPVTDKLKAENGSATTSFTVTNTTSRPLRGFAKIKPLGNTESSWIKIDGELERDFPAGGTHQYTVSFNKPKQSPPPTVSQPAEFFPFRFDEFSATDPQSDFSEGPVVTVEIPEVIITGGGRRRWILILIAILLVVGAIVGYLLYPSDPKPKEIPTATSTPTPIVEKVVVSPVINKTFAEAEKELTDKGFKVEKVQVIDGDRKIDTVFDQEPDAGEEAEAKSIVKVSIPAVTNVPPLKGKCFSVAFKELVEKQLSIGTYSGNEEEIANCTRRVGSVDPEEGKPIVIGGKVNLNFPCVPLIFRPCSRTDWSHKYGNLKTLPRTLEKNRTSPSP